jgi:hypothetical protein
MTYVNPMKCIRIQIRPNLENIHQKFESDAQFYRLDLAREFLASKGIDDVKPLFKKKRKKYARSKRRMEQTT